MVLVNNFYKIYIAHNPGRNYESVNTSFVKMGSVVRHHGGAYKHTWTVKTITSVCVHRSRAVTQADSASKQVYCWYMLSINIKIKSNVARKRKYVLMKIT